MTFFPVNIYHCLVIFYMPITFVGSFLERVMKSSGKVVSHITYLLGSCIPPDCNMAHILLSNHLHTRDADHASLNLAIYSMLVGISQMYIRYIMFCSLIATINEAPS